MYFTGFNPRNRSAVPLFVIGTGWSGTGFCFNTKLGHGLNLKTLRYLVRMIRNDFRNIIHRATKRNTTVQFFNGVKADPRRLFQIFFLHVFNYQQFS